MHRLAACLLASALAFPLFATEPNPSAHQRELIDRLINVTKMNDSMRSVMDSMFAQLEKQFADQAKGSDADELAEMTEVFESFRAKAAKANFADDIHESLVRVYAKYYSESELSDLLAFYGSRTGQKTLEVMPQLMNETMQIASEQLAPKIQKMMEQAQDEAEHRRPWRGTMKDMRSVGFALEEYAGAHDDLYPSGDYESLKALLSPEFIKEFPDKDMWGHAYAYVVSDDHKHYRIVSGGADTNFEWDSRRIVLPKEGQEQVTSYRDRLEDDLIFADGSFAQLPLQAKPKPKK